MSAPMLSSKPKSGVSDTSKTKTSPATPRVARLGRAVSTRSDSNTSSTLQNTRVSIDRSPKSVDSKPTVERRSLKLSTPDKLPRALKGSELQAQIDISKEDLKKAREQLVLVENEKAQANEELKEAKRLADEAHEKLKEAVVAQKRAEENTEIEKFRAVELEQVSIDAAQKKEEEWQTKIESIRNQHAADLAALLSTTQELQKVQNELEMASDAKNTALNHADDAMKIAEINADKAAFLSAEVTRLKALLDSKMENMSKDSAELVKKLDSEVDALRNELEAAKSTAEKLVEVEAVVEGLKTQVTIAKRAETDIGKLVDEWKGKAELLEAQVEEANVSENRSTELVKKLNSEVEDLKNELEKAKTSEEKLVKMEDLVEGLKIEVTDARMAEMHAGKLVDEWKAKADLLQVQAEEADQSLNRNAELVKKLEIELETLNHELERAKAVEEKLVVMEALVEELSTEVIDAKRAETDAGKLVDEWKWKAELLEVQVEEANQSESSSLNSLASVSKQLEENNLQLQEAKTETMALKSMVESLKEEVSRHNADLELSDQRLNVAQQEASEMSKTIEVLKVELQKSSEEKLQALDNEKLAASSVESLSVERNKLLNELEASKDEGEKAKKAMEGLASALHEVSAEARETQERFLIKQAELEEANAEAEELRSTLENTKESYEIMLDEARYELVCLRNSIERNEAEVKISGAEWETKELNFVNAIQKFEEELASHKVEMGKVVNSLKEVEHEAESAKEAEIQMATKLREAESREVIANEAVDEAKNGNMMLKETLLDKENELQSITQENDELRAREAAAVEKVKRLSTLLAEATAKGPHENGELTKCQNLPTRVEYQKENNNENGAEKPKKEIVPRKLEDSCRESNILTENENLNEVEESGKVEATESNSEVVDRDLGSEREHETESTDDESYSKIDSSSFSQMNGLSFEKPDNGAVSPMKSQQQKKKKPLLQKFGSLLKKKSSSKQ